MNDEDKELYQRREEIQKAGKLRAKLRRASKENSLAKEFLASTPTLIQYVRDKFGFRKGVVISTGPGIVGWSLVSSEDYVHEHVALAGIPHLAAIISAAEADVEDTPIDTLIKDRGFKEWSANGGWIHKPQFDRRTGLLNAIDCMKAVRVVIAAEDVDALDIEFPYDKDLRRAIYEMIERSHRYFQDN